MNDSTKKRIFAYNENLVEIDIFLKAQPIQRYSKLYGQFSKKAHSKKKKKSFMKIHRSPEIQAGDFPRAQIFKFGFYAPQHRLFALAIRVPPKEPERRSKKTTFYLGVQKQAIKFYYTIVKMTRALSRRGVAFVARPIKMCLLCAHPLHARNLKFMVRFRAFPKWRYINPCIENSPSEISHFRAKSFKLANFRYTLKNWIYTKLFTFI